MHVPPQLAEAVPVDGQVRAADERRRVERGPLAGAQIEQARERRCLRRGGDAVLRDPADPGRFPLRGPRLRLELDHLRAEADDEGLIDDPHELRRTIVARAEVLVIETSGDDREKHRVLGAPVEAVTVHDAVAVALDAEDRDAALMRVAPARHAGVVAHEHDPLRQGELFELRHDVELARALTTVDDRDLAALDVELAVVGALVELLPADEECFIIALLGNAHAMRASSRWIRSV